MAVAERLGMALRMSPQRATTPELGAAVRRLLDEPAFANAAARAAHHYEGVDGAAGAADAMLTWLERSAPISRP